ncbi:MAG: chemotaxis protein CheA [Thermodesulfobacteriota bacterium]
MTEQNSKKALKEFLTEVEELTENMNSDLLRLSEGTSTGSVDPDLLNSIFRAAHTIKGLSGMFGFSGMSSLSHNMENVFDSIRLGKIEPNPQILDILFEGVDIINRFLAAKGEKEGENIEGFIERLNNVITGDSPAKTSSSFEAIELSEDVLNVLTEYEEHRLKENIREGKNLFIIKAHFSLEEFEEGLTETNKRIKAIGEIIATLPSSSNDNQDEMCFDILAGTGKDLKAMQEGVKVKGKDIIAIKKKECVSAKVPKESPESPRVELPTPPSAHPQKPSEPNNTRPKENQSLRSISNTVRVDIARLDGIMNIVGELFLNRAGIEKIANSIKFKLGFKGMAVDIYKLNNDLEKKLYDLRARVLEVRMVPISQLFDKVARVVKRITLDSGKDVKLIIKGADTQLDKLIIEDLADPLLHLIRNTLDHGIETPEKRKAKGKPPQGTVHLKAYHKGNHVAIEVEDDGAGIDIKKLARIAVEKGFISEEEALKQKEELLDLIFLPGFSTKKEVSEISGRGVGMDVVKENLSRLSGTVDIATEKERGTKFTLTLPITLAIIKAVTASVNKKIYAIPINSVLEIISISANDIKTIERQEVIELRGKTLPLVRLNRFFDLSSETPAHDMLFVVLVGLAEQRLGLLVDDILGEQDIVIKPLGKGLEDIPGIAGAAELSGQKTILVIDPGGIIARSVRSTGVSGSQAKGFGPGVNTLDAVGRVEAN